MCIVTALLLVVVSSAVASGRDLKVIEYPTPGNSVSASIPYDPNYPFPSNGQADIPMEELAKVGPEFAPDQLHIELWTPTSMRISWATGFGNVTIDDGVSRAYDPESVPSVVRYGTSPDALVMNVTRGSPGVLAKALVYEYVYDAAAGAINGSGTVYNSPILHHVILDSLDQGQKYYYSVGSEEYGFSDVYSFTVPKREYPFKVGVVADVGQTYNSSATLNRTLADDPAALLFIGDLSYADDWLPNGTYCCLPNTTSAGGGYFKTYQPKWDTFGRLAEPLLATVPHMSTHGNHELESQYARNNITHMAYNARYPNPRDPAVINTEPNYVDQYWDQSLLPAEGKFVEDSISSKIVTNNTWYSINIGPMHMVFLDNYVPYSNTSEMYKWLDEDLSAVDRSETPWLLVGFHAAWYTTYVNHYKENSNMQLFFEPLFLKHRVDLVLNGHIHAYDRSPPVFSFEPNSCGPIYISVGDGGNVEGLYKQFVDQDPIPAYCSNSSIWRPAVYQPTYSGIGYVDPNTPFCYSSQAPWSDYRDPSFGHGLITFLNDTALRWQWNKNVDPADQWNDDIIVTKNPSTTGCNDKVVMGTERAANADAQAIPDAALPASPDNVSPPTPASPDNVSPPTPAPGPPSSAVSIPLMSCLISVAIIILV